MMREYKLKAIVGKPQVAYRETIRKHAEAEGKYIRQTGGRGQYGHAKIKLDPQPAGTGYEFVHDVVGGSVPKEFINPIDQGIQEALEGGILAGYPMVDVKATLYDGSYHAVDSNEMAFKIAGSMAFKEAARDRKPVLLEPVMSVEVTVPEEYMARSSAISTRAVDGLKVWRWLAARRPSGPPCRSAPCLVTPPT